MTDKINIQQHHLQPRRRSLGILPCLYLPTSQLYPVLLQEVHVERDVLQGEDDLVTRTGGF